MPDFVGDNFARGVKQGQSLGGAVGSDASIDERNDAKTAMDVQERARALAKQLLSAHPDYLDEAPKWEKYLDLYESNDVYRFIFEHARESSPDFARRKKRGCFDNYVASVVNLLTSYIFSGQIERELPAKHRSLFADEVYPDADRAGTAWDLFWAEATTYALVEGHIGVLVDAPRLEEEINEAERKSQKVRPYLQMFHTHQILDWELDEFGKFSFIKLVFQRPQVRTWDQPVDPTRKNVLIYSKEHWEEYLVTGEPNKETAVLLEDGPNPRGEVPFSVLRFLKSGRHQWFGRSFVKEIADMNIGILNWSSLGDEEIYERCLNVLAMQDDDLDTPVKLGHGNVLKYSGENTPSYLIPGTTPLDLIMRWIGFHIDEILRLAKLKGPTGLGDVREASSGIAYAFEFNETNQALCTKAVILEGVEQEVHRLITLFTENPAELKDFTVRYPREFGVDDALVDFQILQQARSSLTSKTAIQEIEKRIVRRHLPKISGSKIKVIDKEISESPAEDLSMESAFGMQGNVGGQPPVDNNSPPDPTEGDNTQEE